MSAIQLIETLAFDLYSATLVGDPAPRIDELRKRMNAPVPGDLVLECSSIGYQDRDGKRLGRLMRTVMEPVCSAHEWYDVNENDPMSPIPCERAWYITLPDGEEARWSNASFIAVPTEPLGSIHPDFQSDGRKIYDLKAV